jgi:hypothetical protein
LILDACYLLLISPSVILILPQKEKDLASLSFWSHHAKLMVNSAKHLSAGLCLLLET